MKCIFQNSPKVWVLDSRAFPIPEVQQVSVAVKLGSCSGSRESKSCARLFVVFISPPAVSGIVPWLGHEASSQNPSYVTNQPAILRCVRIIQLTAA